MLPLPATRRVFFAFALTTTMLTPLLASAQRGDVAVDRAERADDRRDARTERRDLAQIASIATAWSAAVARGDRAAEQAADVRLAGWMREELGDAASDVGETSREAARSEAERRGSRSEAVVSGTRDDRRDLRDDRRDARDDRRDAVDARVDYARVHAIAVELQSMQPAFRGGTATPAQYARKRALLDELVRMAAGEVREERRELREDRRETGEDRRERREDRRTRRR